MLEVQAVPVNVIHFVEDDPFPPEHFAHSSQIRQLAAGRGIGETRVQSAYCGTVGFDLVFTTIRKCVTCKRCRA